MKNKVLLCLFLITLCEGQLLAADTIQFVNKEYHAHFKGVLWQVVENDSIYRGVVVDSTLEPQYGFFTKDLSYQNYVCLYSNLKKTVTIDGELNFSTRRWNTHYICELYSNKFDDDGFVGCKYSPDENLWFQGTICYYDKFGLMKTGDSFEPAGVDDWNDSDLKYVIYGPFIWAFWGLFLYDVIKLIFKKKKALVSSLLSFLPTVLIYIIIPHDILCYQFFIPLIFFIVLWFLSRKNKHIRILIKSIAYTVLILCVIFNNFILNDKVIIGNEAKDVKWKAGTGILKRYLIKNELSKLQDVTIDNQRSGGYSLYVGENVMSDGVFGAVIGSPFWCISCLTGKLNEPITYREYVYFLERLEEITGLDNFDLLRYDELKDLNDNGSVFLEKEFNELTSSYRTRYQAIDDNRFIPVYDNIVYVDSSCIDVNGKLCNGYRYKYKNAVIYDATARLVMRKKNRRHFSIMGIKVNPANKNLPDSIMILSMNNRQIEKTCYEQFEEFEIESYYNNRIIEYMTNYVEMPKSLYQQAGESDYWFIPIFSYN